MRWLGFDRGEPFVACNALAVQADLAICDGCVDLIYSLAGR
jgi:hypothetical protein